MAALITLTQAKQHLRIDTDDADADIYLKVVQASAIVVNYLKTTTAAAWTTADVPGPVQAATLLLLTHLHEHRGEDMAADQTLWLAMDRILCRYRDPALA